MFFRKTFADLRVRLSFGPFMNENLCPFCNRPVEEFGELCVICAESIKEEQAEKDKK